MEKNIISDEAYIEMLRPYDADYAEKLEKGRMTFIGCKGFDDSKFIK